MTVLENLGACKAATIIRYMPCQHSNLNAPCNDQRSHLLGQVTGYTHDITAYELQQPARCKTCKDMHAAALFNDHLQQIEHGNG